MLAKLSSPQMIVGGEVSCGKIRGMSLHLSLDTL